MNILKFDDTGHYDDFDDEVIFWIELSDLPQKIQNIAKKIDGENYVDTCFGACISYDKMTKEFSIATEQNKSIYYVDNNGDKTWFKVDLIDEFKKQIFEECNKILLKTERKVSPKKSIAQQLKDGAAQAAKDNTDRPTPSKNTEQNR